MRADADWSIEFSVAFDHKECGVFWIGTGRIRATVLAASGWNGSALQIGGGRGTQIRIADRANRSFEETFKDFYGQRLADPGVRRRVEKDPARAISTFCCLVCLPIHIIEIFTGHTVEVIKVILILRNHNALSCFIYKKKGLKHVSDTILK